MHEKPDAVTPDDAPHASVTPMQWAESASLYLLRALSPRYALTPIATTPTLATATPATR